MYIQKFTYTCILIYVYTYKPRVVLIKYFPRRVSIKCLPHRMTPPVLRSRSFVERNSINILFICQTARFVPHNNKNNKKPFLLPACGLPQYKQLVCIGMYCKYALVNIFISMSNCVALNMLVFYVWHQLFLVFIFVLLPSQFCSA